MRKALALFFFVALLAAVPVVAAADSKPLEFEAATPLAVVGPLQVLDPFTATPMDTEAEFKLNKDDTIKRVKVETTNEFIVGTDIEADCIKPSEPPGDPFCDALDATIFTSLHDSEARLTDIVVVPGVAVLPAPGFGEPDFTAVTVLVAGDIKGKLSGVLTIGIPVAPPFTIGGDSMAGTMKLKIRRNPTVPPPAPAAIYGCVASLDVLLPDFSPNPDFFSPLDISDCVDDDGKLVPLFLNILDTGKMKVEDTFGDFEDIEKLKAKVDVTISGLAGAVTISDGKAKR